MSPGKRVAMVLLALNQGAAKTECRYHHETAPFQADWLPKQPPEIFWKNRPPGAPRDAQELIPRDAAGILAAGEPRVTSIFKKSDHDLR
jgi:hypothetical protein